MDAVFFLEEEARADFFQTIAKTTGCSYICLWSYVYVPLLSDCLVFKDGWCNVECDQPSSSSGIRIQMLFDAYTQTQHIMSNGFVPGLAFKDGNPYLEVGELELLHRSSNECQKQFYQEARIKSAAFLGCRSGEIEIGMPTSIPVNMKFDISNWAQQLQFKGLIPPPQDQEWPSSSSSSFRSLSGGSPENSPPLFGMASSTSYIPEALKDPLFEQAIRPTSAAVLPHQHQPLEAYDHLRIQRLNPDSDNAAITRAMLAVMSSPSVSSSYNQQYSSQSSQPTGAFKEYTSVLSPTVQMKVNSPGRQNMFKQSISIMRRDQSWKEEITQGNTSKNSQLLHKISEQKRREKLNESFQELKSLLPLSSKKGKASILSNTLDYLETLKSEVTELRQKNQLLEARTTQVGRIGENVTHERIDIRITHLSEITSEEQEIELRVTVRDCNIMDLIIDVLEYLKLGKEASLLSMDADTETLQTILINHVILKLKIKGYLEFETVTEHLEHLEHLWSLGRQTWASAESCTVAPCQLHGPCRSLQLFGPLSTNSAFSTGAPCHWHGPC